MRLVIRARLVQLPCTGALVELGQVDEFPHLYAVGPGPAAVFADLTTRAAAASRQARQDAAALVRRGRHHVVELVGSGWRCVDCRATFTDPPARDLQCPAAGQPLKAVG